MARLIFFAVLAFAAFLFWKKLQKPSLRRPPRDDGPAPAQAAARKALTDHQQALYSRLQSALPSTMLLVQPTLGQVVDTGADAARFSNVPIDFAVCRKDSTPIGVVVLDDQVGPAVEQAVTRAGLRFARFRSGHLPDEREIKDALGFL